MIGAPPPVFKSVEDKNHASRLICSAPFFTLPDKLPMFLRPSTADLVLILALSFSPLANATASLPPTVSSALKQAGIPLGHTAILVQAVEGKAPPRIALNIHHAMNPASVMKLLTTYAALNTLGPNWRWRTTAWTETMPRHGVLESPLYLKGSGDPKFVLEHLTGLLRQLRVRGIQHLRDGIVLDRSAFDIPATNPGAFDELPMRPYNIGPDALLMNFRAVTLTLLPGETAPQILLETPAAGLTIDNQLRAGKGHCEDWKDRIRPRLKSGNGNPSVLELTGTLNPACGNQVLNLSPLSEDDYAASLIRALWQELGGELTGPVRSGTLPPQPVLLAEHISPPLSEQVRDINKFSNNVMARQVFLSLSENTPATLESARKSTETWLAKQGMAFHELVMDNGSGLSRQERINAENLGKLLTHAWHSPLMPEFIASLPIVGLDGTMKKRLKDPGNAGRAHLKTGTLDGVKSIAGYVLDKQGHRYLVVFLINDPKASQGQAAMDALVRWVMGQ